MKITSWIVASMMVPAVAFAQGPAQAGAPIKTTLDRMQANVAQIPASAEKERWQANFAMWKTVLGATGTLTATEMTALKARLATMKANVAKVTIPEEKERWQANVAMWMAFVQGGKISAAEAAANGGALDKMKSNVAKITEPAEKERWQANCDLWQSRAKATP